MNEREILKLRSPVAGVWYMRFGVHLNIRL